MGIPDRFRTPNFPKPAAPPAAKAKKAHAASTPIPPERLAVIFKTTICQPARDWLSVPGRTYEDLAEHPDWAYLAAKIPGADVARLQAVVVAHGSPKLRRLFAEEVPGADRALLLGS